MELKQYWSVIRKRLWFILLLIVVACTATGVYSYTFITPKYEASTKLIVNQTGGSSDLLAKLDLGTINSNIQLVKTYKEIIKTPRIMDLVVERYPDLGVSSGELIRKVSVSSINDTQVMSVTAQDGSYARAAKIANAVSKVFVSQIPVLMKMDNVSVLNEANPQAGAPPIAPNPPLNIAAAFMVALMLSVGIAFLLDYLDDTIKTEEDITELLGLPTLSVIPRIREGDLTRYREEKLQTGARREKNVTYEA
ncbi:lipopolysaccharide biosynthesis protein [Paenibacillus sp. IB182496]|uniref:Lipopolysaccharide biosynthesis protein n=1 Tax=Paenibacillus sabuli TaxID=2772509 RepID=A0A927GVB7_9BACL|nr:Wzz/FepE/Etk N-terminal domain-containing protein [Paenibacillus sabuli]MBD2848582.1 lipopolysaccharide biosynthesis protein [Paenibacillus sabuli]